MAVVGLEPELLEQCRRGDDPCKTAVRFSVELGSRLDPHRPVAQRIEEMERVDTGTENDERGLNRVEAGALIQPRCHEWRRRVYGGDEVPKDVVELGTPQVPGKGDGDRVSIYWKQPEGLAVYPTCNDDVSEGSVIRRVCDIPSAEPLGVRHRQAHGIGPERPPARAPRQAGPLGL